MFNIYNRSKKAIPKVIVTLRRRPKVSRRGKMVSREETTI
jgi:hypothetical protein